MADGSGERWSAVVGSGRHANLVEGLSANRHLRARCDCCGAREPFVPEPALLRQVGEDGLASLYSRFRCFCGARQAFLEVWTGTAPQVGEEPRIWLFR